jgi:putative transposase
VKYVDPAYTSSLCPACGGESTPSGYRLRKYMKCGLEEDRDTIAVKNLAKRYYEEGRKFQKPILTPSAR